MNIFYKSKFYKSIKKLDFISTADLKFMISEYGRDYSVKYFLPFYMRVYITYLYNKNDS